VQSKSRLLGYSSAAGAIFALAWLAFWEYCYQTAPRVADEATNRVNFVNYHGTPLYLSDIEYFILYAIPGTLLIVGVVSALVIKYKK
jgi:hypothetical protein